MNDETKQKIKTRAYVLFLIGMFAFGLIVGHTLFSDATEQNEEEPQEVPKSAYECDYCHDTDTVIIIVLEDGVPTAKAFPCPYHTGGGA